MKDQMMPAAASEIVMGRMKTVRKTVPARVVYRMRMDTSSEKATTSRGKTTSQMAGVSTAFQKAGAVRGGVVLSNPADPQGAGSTGGQGRSSPQRKKLLSTVTSA